MIISTPIDIIIVTIIVITYCKQGSKTPLQVVEGEFLCAFRRLIPKIYFSRSRFTGIYTVQLQWLDLPKLHMSKKYTDTIWYTLVNSGTSFIYYHR
ncbi:MAG: hypothetical protein ACI89U_003403 [Gammaproteobacteria bacterium]|jgi:hypothetical protein